MEDKYVSSRKEKQNLGRLHPKTLSSVEWAAITFAVEQYVRSAEKKNKTSEFIFQDERDEIVQRLLPLLKEDVQIYREIDPIGLGLDFQWRKDW